MPDERSTDIVDYLKSLLHHWIAGVVALIVVAGAAGVFLLRGGTEGSYASMVHVAVSQTGVKTEAQAITAGDAYARRMFGLAAVGTQEKVRAQAAKNLGGNVTADDLTGAVAIKWGANSDVLDVTAKAPDRETADARAVAMAKALTTSVADGLMPETDSGIGYRLTIVDDPAPDPTSQSTARGKGQVVVAAGLAGLIAGVAVMAVFEAVAAHRRR